MARKFIYFIATMTVLFLAGAFILDAYGEDLAEFVFVPEIEFEEQVQLEDNVYAEVNMWLAHPEKKTKNPALWLPQGFEDSEPKLSDDDKAAIFFVHPTSFLKKNHWNAPLDDQESQARARIFLRGQASAFNAVGDVWAPRYRQAAIGAFLTDKEEGQMALDAAYQDVLIAFDQFLASVPAQQPIILAGHSQGSLHLTNLLKDRVAGTPLVNRIVAAYVVGWPVSVEADVPALGLAPCNAPEQNNCLLSWESFAEPADYDNILQVYNRTEGFTGKPRTDTQLLCTNPVAGATKVATIAEQNLGTLVPNDELSDATLIEGAVPASCDDRGFLLIGDPPDLGPYTLPGNNYHVYDYSLFWSNIRADAMRRLLAFQKR